MVDYLLKTYNSFEAPSCSQFVIALLYKNSYNFFDFDPILIKQKLFMKEQPPDSASPNQQPPPAAPPPPSLSSTGACPKQPKAGRPPGKKPLTANNKFRLPKQQGADTKKNKPLTQAAKKLTGAELLPHQHGKLPFEGQFNELVGKVSTELTPKRKHKQQQQPPQPPQQQQQPSEGKELHAIDSEEEWTDTESQADA